MPEDPQINTLDDFRHIAVADAAGAREVVKLLIEPLVKRAPGAFIAA
jgi:hypothetical protein